jgi:hypothetical protein
MGDRPAAGRRGAREGRRQGGHEDWGHDVGEVGRSEDGDRPIGGRDGDGSIGGWDGDGSIGGWDGDGSVGGWDGARWASAGYAAAGGGGDQHGAGHDDRADRRARDADDQVGGDPRDAERSGDEDSGHGRGRNGGRQVGRR